MSPKILKKGAAIALILKNGFIISGKLKKEVRISPATEIMDEINVLHLTEAIVNRDGNQTMFPLEITVVINEIAVWG
ncbi:MAG: hypothetical protein Q7R93_03815 [bacterium]|nr:hypothetical protein [bacterium]